MLGTETIHPWGVSGDLYIADSPGCLTYDATACRASRRGCVSASWVSKIIQAMKPNMPKVSAEE